jgi:hypothetical protein
VVAGDGSLVPSVVMIVAVGTTVAVLIGSSVGASSSQP